MKGIALQENELTWGGGKALNLDLEETIPEPPSGFSVGLSTYSLCPYNVEVKSTVRLVMVCVSLETQQEPRDTAIQFARLS